MADYVLLAACHAKQIAQEYRDNDSGQSVTYGAMTYALTETLATLQTRDVTCRELFELTRDKVRAWYPQQIPQCEGDRDRLLTSVRNVQARIFRLW
ncbi:MAG: caspase family protein [Planctomycetaceae bacterium]